jgi:hypothetical protein
MGTDLVASYPPEALFRESTPGRWLRYLVELVRDVLLFVPVAFTWIRLSSALHAYDKTKGDQPFLTAWESGMNHTTTPLSTTASDVAWIVGCVIGLTGLLHLLDGWAGRVETTRDKFTVALTRATYLVRNLAPMSGTTVSPAALNQIGAQIASSSTELKTSLTVAARDITQAVAAGPGTPLRNALNEWNKAADRLFDVAQALRAPQETLNQAALLQKSVAAETVKLDAIMQSLTRELREATAAGRKQAHSQSLVSDAVASSTDRLGSALSALNDQAAVFGEIVNRLRYMVATLDGEGVRRWDGAPFENIPPSPGER